GEPPFDGVDAVFVSHYHDDHFSPPDLIELLRRRGDVHLYAPAQAVAALRAVGGADEESDARRHHAVDLAYGDEPQRIEMPGLLIEAARIPHAGWPELTDVENVAWRITLDESTTVLHLGDADTDDAHFAPHEAHWRQRRLHLAFPPYWYFLS